MHHGCAGPNGDHGLLHHTHTISRGMDRKNAVAHAYGMSFGREPGMPGNDRSAIGEGNR